jgi:hypothetical protein
MFHEISNVVHYYTDFPRISKALRRERFFNGGKRVWSVYQLITEYLFGCPRQRNRWDCCTMINE